jgi:Family of unknown function (DUF6356)
MFKHLKDRNYTYTGHFCFAVYAGTVLIIAGIASIIHAVLPCVFATYSERKVKELLDQSQERYDQSQRQP